MVSAGVNQAIYGGSFGSAFVHSFLADLGALGAHTIGQALPSGSAGNILAHATLGCAAAAAGSKDCASAALGAASAAALNPLLDGLTSREDATLRSAQLAGLSSLTSGVIARAAGANVGEAISAAQNETLNNYLSSSQKSQRLEELARCADALCRARVGAAWALQDKLQDGGFAAGLGGGLGLGAYHDAEGLVEALGALVGQPGQTLAALRAFIDDPEVRERAGDAFFADYEQRLDTLQRAYEDAGWQGSVSAGVETGRLLWDAAAIASGIGAATKLTAKVGAVGGRAAAAALDDLVAHAGARGQVGAVGDVAWAARSTGDNAGAAKGVTYSGITGPGPLGARVASTFRSGTYTELTTIEATTLYRVWGGKAGELGPYWTRTPPSGPVQSVLDSALNPAWGNTATNVTRIQVPSGVKIYEGVAAAQGGLVGGGSQVFIPRVDPGWIVR